MLHRLQGFAHWLRPARPLLAALGLLAFVIAAYLVLFGDPQTSDPLLLPAILGLLWCLCAVVFISTFEAVPPAPTPDVTGLSRLKRRVARLWYGLLALVFLGLTVAALLLTNRLLGEALG